MKKPPRQKKLKAFRAAAGFDDAFVAAPSKKAALEAWGTSKILFAIGGAEQVDPSEAPEDVFSQPGKVVLRSRGSLADQLKASGPVQTGRHGRKEATPRPSDPEPRSGPAARVRPQPQRKPKPPPSRAALEAAEAAVAAAAEQHKREIVLIDEEIRLLEQRKRQSNANAQAILARLEAKVSHLSDRYHAALDTWAADE